MFVKSFRGKNTQIPLCCQDGVVCTEAGFFLPNASGVHLTVMQSCCGFLIRQGVIQSNSKKQVSIVFFYHCVMEQLHDPEIGIYTSFGIAAFCASQGRRRKLRVISDVSIDSALVTRLAELCTACQLDPVHLMDVVEDALAV